MSWSGRTVRGSAAGSTTGYASAEAWGTGLHTTSSAMVAAMEASRRIITGFLGYG
ncbi:peptidase S8 and S53, subtilisin, kexin, sedolisin domain protein [Mycobacterium kansasii]|uniref:Peptidase S8 and S53, subtilisin, kexin, sedolisin domain protein n=1 Tax=Mycobacterium kansasii TaxID=1768 RepID=A0A1V3WEN8_MYCKA|nr:peptidase S8 and S53, subtilisin, kexin, sedolisin domain protein [Mycobacterium kansasii]